VDAVTVESIVTIDRTNKAGTKRVIVIAHRDAAGMRMPIDIRVEVNGDAYLVQKSAEGMLQGLAELAAEAEGD
jgi:hypothetical protein